MVQGLDVQNPRFDEAAVEEQTKELEAQVAIGDGPEPARQGNWWQRRTKEGKRLVLIGGGLAAMVVVLLGISIGTGSSTTVTQPPVNGTLAPTRSPTRPGETRSPTMAPVTLAPTLPTATSPPVDPSEIIPKDGVNNEAEPSDEWDDNKVCPCDDCVSGEPNWVPIGEVSCQPLNAFIKKARPVAVKRLQDGVNVAAGEDAVTGSLVAGLVLKSCPDYEFTWARDQAVVYGAMLDEAERLPVGDDKRNSLIKMVTGYGDHAHIWYEKNKKYEGTNDKQYMAFAKVDFNGDGVTAWCNPQNDGPALRAIQLMRLYDMLSDEGAKAGLYNNKLEKDKRNPIKRDLQYLVDYYDTENCEPWEEIKGVHFYDRIVAYRAFTRGAAFAKARGDNGFATILEGKAAEAKNKINADHWKEAEMTIQSEKGDRGDRKDDIQTTFAMAHAYLDENDFFGPGDTRMMANALFTIKSFNTYWKINEIGWKGRHDLGPAIGRYVHDSYGGGCAVSTKICPEGSGWNSNCAGNAWHLAVSAMAEFFYRVARYYLEQPSITIDKYNGPTFEWFGAGHIFDGLDYETGTFSFNKGSVEYDRLITILIHAGDQFLRRNQFHTSKDFQFWEQFNGITGYQHSTRQLTWSFAALYTAMEQRELMNANALLKDFTFGDHVDVEVVAAAIPHEGYTPVILFNGETDCSKGVKLYVRRKVRDLSDWSTFVKLEKNALYQNVRVGAMVEANGGVQCELSTKTHEIRTWESNKLLPEYFEWVCEDESKCPKPDLSAPKTATIRFRFDANELSDFPFYKFKLAGNRDDTAGGVGPFNWAPCASQVVGVRSNNVVSFTVTMARDVTSIQYKLVTARLTSAEQSDGCTSNTGNGAYEFEGGGNRMLDWSSVSPGDVIVHAA